MKMLRPLGILVVACLSWGCATLDPKLEVQTFGEADPIRDEQLIAVAEALEETPAVRVIQGDLPEGLDLTEGASKILIAPGYEETYKVLGTVAADYSAPVSDSVSMNAYWTVKYPRGWRRNYCYPQAPLKLLTVGIWATLVPLSYPCWANPPSSSKEREIALLEKLKRGADALGGDLIILTHEEDAFNVGSSGPSALKGFVLKVLSHKPTHKHAL